MLTIDHIGVHCSAGQFHIDPWRGADRALITHAHSDHARPGSQHYLCAAEGVGVLRRRIGKSASIQGLPYGEVIDINGVRVSFHPAGHVLGSAQIRLECHGEIWVVSGDYKTAADPTCAPFEPIHCHTFITESTFALPVFRWPEPQVVMAELQQWWLQNQHHSRNSVVFAYSLGKAQRALAALDPTTGPILLHPAIAEFIPDYEAAGIHFPAAFLADSTHLGAAQGRALILAPPTVESSPWFDSLGECATAMVSGWMQIRGIRRRSNRDHGFVLSDHADWPGLLSAIRATRAERILVTHGYVAPLVRWLNEGGWKAEAFSAETRVGFTAKNAKNAESETLDF